MSSGYRAISRFDFSIDRFNDVLGKLNKNCGDFEGSDISWKLDDHIKTDADILNDLDDGYISIYGSSSMNMEVLISKEAIAVSDLAGWKWLLYQASTREQALKICKKIATCIGLNKQFFVPDATFLTCSPVELFMVGEGYEKIITWTEENLTEIFSFDQFSDDPKHHDVYFEISY